VCQGDDAGHIRILGKTASREVVRNPPRDVGGAVDGRDDGNVVPRTRALPMSRIAQEGLSLTQWPKRYPRQVICRLTIVG
jgi:hypothetical protein